MTDKTVESPFESPRGEVEGPFGVPVPQREASATLRAEELNLFDSTAVAVSSVAPAYSISSTMAFLVAVAGVGLFAPSVVILSFIPVLFVAFAYFHLNRKDPDCGASYSWVSKLTSPLLGWFNGWVQVALSVIFCVIAPLLAGYNVLQFFHSIGWVSLSAVSNIGLISVIGAAVLALVTFICIWGIRWTTNFQWVLVMIEYVAVLGFSLYGIARVAISPPKGAPGFHFAWLNPFNLSGFAAISGGMVLGVFLFWGWDTAVNLNEESKEATKNPGRAGIISMFLLLLVFLLNIIGAEMLLPESTITAQGTNLPVYFAQHAVGSWAGYVMLFAILTSTVATTQTTLLPAARITYSMARDKVFPSAFGTIQGKLKTPVVGTLILAFICLFGVLLTSRSQSGYNFVENALVTDIGVLIGFYYGITGLTCGWAYRKVAFKSIRFFFMGIILPMFSGVILLLIGAKVFWTQWTNPGDNLAWPILAVFAVGVILLVIARLASKGSFFKTKTIAYDSID